MAAAQSDNELADQPANKPPNPLADHYRRRAAWLRRESTTLLEQAEWHDRHAARLEKTTPTVPPPGPPDMPSRVDDGDSVWQMLAGAFAGGLIALLWDRRRSPQQPHAGTSDRMHLRASVLDDAVAPTLPSRLPECCIEVLSRPGWYDRRLLHSVKIKPANRFVRAISNPRVAGTDIAATTIGDTIYFRQAERFDPHTPEGLALLAHEIRHVEQYQALGGILGFGLHYVREFLRGGYGTNISFEDEAYAIQRAVADHLRREFAHNADAAPCLMTAGGHRRNPEYVSLRSYPDLDRWATGSQAMV